MTRAALVALLALCTLAAAGPGPAARESLEEMDKPPCSFPESKALPYSADKLPTPRTPQDAEGTTPTPPSANDTEPVIHPKVCDPGTKLAEGTKGKGGSIRACTLPAGGGGDDDCRSASDFLAADNGKITELCNLTHWLPEARAAGPVHQCSVARDAFNSSLELGPVVELSPEQLAGLDTSSVKCLQPSANLSGAALAAAAVSANDSLPSTWMHDGSSIFLLVLPKEWIHCKKRSQPSIATPGPASEAKDMTSSPAPEPSSTSAAAASSTSDATTAANAAPAAATSPATPDVSPSATASSSPSPTIPKPATAANATNTTNTSNTSNTSTVPLANSTSTSTVAPPALPAVVPTSSKQDAAKPTDPPQEKSTKPVIKPKPEPTKPTQKPKDATKATEKPAETSPTTTTKKPSEAASEKARDIVNPVEHDNEIGHRGPSPHPPEALSQQHSEHDHASSGKTAFLQPTESAAILAGVFVAIALLGYAGLMLWRRVLEKRYGNREMLVNEDDDFDTSDMRHFEL